MILHPTLRVELLAAYQAFVFASFKLTLCKHNNNIKVILMRNLSMPLYAYEKKGLKCGYSVLLKFLLYSTVSLPGKYFKTILLGLATVCRVVKYKI